MSNWTHVAGVIRIDSFRFGDDEGEPNFDDVIGKELHFHDSSEQWDYAFKHKDEYLPLGSEGSLQKSIWINPDKDNVASYTVTIFGDLRDHHSPDDIIEWFKSVCAKVWVRNAIITVQNEWNGTKDWRYVEEEESEEKKS